MSKVYLIEDNKVQPTPVKSVPKYIINTLFK